MPRKMGRHVEACSAQRKTSTLALVVGSYSPHLQVTGTPNLIELARVWEAGSWVRAKFLPEGTALVTSGGMADTKRG